MWVQAITTGEPDELQVEVAVASLLTALEPDQIAEVAQRGPIVEGALDAIRLNEANGPEDEEDPNLLEEPADG